MGLGVNCIIDSGGKGRWLASSAGIVGGAGGGARGGLHRRE